MSNNTSILINVGAATAGAVRNLDKVSKSLESQKKTSSSWGRQMFKASNLAKAGFAAVGLAAVGAAGSMIAFGMEAIEDQKQAQNLANTLKNIPGVTKKLIEANADWIDSMELATSISDTELRASMGRLATVTQDVAEAQKLVALAADVSVGRNINLAAATKLVEKAATGHTEALMRQMPWLDKNKDGVLTTKEAIEGLGDAYEGAAEKAANNDPWKRLQTIWGQLKEALGQWILPLLKEFGDWFKKKENQQKIQDFIGKVADLSYQMGVKLVNAIKDFIKWLQSPEGKKAIEDMKRLVTDLNNALKTLMGWFKDLAGWKFILNLNPLHNLLDLIDKIKSGLEWLRNNVPGPFRGALVNLGSTTSSAATATATAASAAPYVGTQVIYATFNLTGTPEENVRQFDRYLKRAGNRGRVTVTA